MKYPTKIHTPTKDSDLKIDLKGNNTTINLQNDKKDNERGTEIPNIEIRIKEM